MNYRLKEAEALLLDLKRKHHFQIRRKYKRELFILVLCMFYGNHKPINLNFEATQVAKCVSLPHLRVALRGILSWRQSNFRCTSLIHLCNGGIEKIRLEDY